MTVFLTPFSRAGVRGVLLLWAVALFMTVASGQIKSRIVGTITDARTGEGLIGANVTLLGTQLGAVADVNGKYFIIGVPVGTYRVQASMLGYAKKAITNVIVSADRVTTIDVALEPGEIEMDAVVVSAKQDKLNKEVSSTQLVATQQQITEAAGIREINTFLAKQPGIASENGYLAIRGGSADQTGTMVNGISYNNAAVGNAETSIPLSAIEQVSVLSGGFNAEYGNFRSGLINVTTKSGAKDAYHGTFTLSKNFEHMKRFGPGLGDPTAPLLAPYMNPDVAFTGTDSTWPWEPFNGWVARAAQYNAGHPEAPATPLDLYLLYSWLFMTIPDYDGLLRYDSSYVVPEDQKRLFAAHARKEQGTDFNFDGGFGGPIPWLVDEIGATFYVSNTTSKQYYTIPVVRAYELKTTTLATIRMEPFERTTLTLNGLWKVQDGVSRIRPAFGDFPDASRDGGFMPIDNIASFVRNTENNEHRMYWFDPPFFPMLKQSTVLGGMTLNHIINNSTFWELSLNYLTIQNSSPTGDNRDTSILTWFGPFPVDEMPYGKWQFASNHRIGGYQYAGYDDPAGIAYYRWRSKEGDLYDNTAVHQLRGKFDLATQFDEHHYLKAGVEYNRINLDHKFWERWNRNSYNIYEFNYDRTPSQTGAYIQDQIAYDWMLANIGLRVDYFYGGGGKWPSGDPFAAAAFTPQPFGNDTLLVQYLESGRSYIWDLWETYDQQHPGFLQPVKNHFTVSPRIGVSFPVTENSKFFFNYSHFRSNPPYYSMFLLRYRYTKNGLYDMSNPNLEPPKTISYELGALYNLAESYSLKASAYYKDVTGQHGEVTYTNAAGDLNYDNWANNNYQDIEGIELSLAKQDNSWITGSLNFNYQLKKSGLTGRQTYSDVAINDDLQGLYAGQESRFLPRPELNATLTFRSQPAVQDGNVQDLLFSGWSATVYGQWRLGNYLGTNPDEAADWNPLREEYLQPFMRWPDYYMLDLKLNKTFKIGGIQATMYVEVNNLLNLKVNIMDRNYCFDLVNRDAFNYFASLRLPMYDRPEFDQFRTQYPGWFIAGNDEIGDVQSEEKPYINNPNYPYFMYTAPREVWIGMRFEF